MTSNSVAGLLSELGVTRSHSRPKVSNDNPYSESWFKTLKYAPTFPQRFQSLHHARDFMDEFVDWYNHERPTRDRRDQPDQANRTGASSDSRLTPRGLKHLDKLRAGASRVPNPLAAKCRDRYPVVGHPRHRIGSGSVCNRFHSSGCRGTPRRRLCRASAGLDLLFQQIANLPE